MNATLPECMYYEDRLNRVDPHRSKARGKGANFLGSIFVELIRNFQLYLLTWTGVLPQKPRPTGFFEGASTVEKGSTPL
jgi:hypothetical protein